MSFRREMTSNANNAVEKTQLRGPAVPLTAFQGTKTILRDGSLLFYIGPQKL